MLTPASVSLSLRGEQVPKIVREMAMRFGNNSAVSDSLAIDCPTFLFYIRESWLYFGGLLLYRLALCGSILL